MACIVGVVSGWQGADKCVDRTTPAYSDLVTGEYQLEYYDEEYTQLLSAMGVPEHVQSLILTV